MSAGENIDADQTAGVAGSSSHQHQSFMVYKDYFYLKIAAAVAGIATAVYAVHRPYGTPYGGTWLGYTLGTLGALLILWLMWFGYRKRTYTRNQGHLQATLSAHVYLGLALLVIATLHTGFHFGWNIHTLAYVLMCLVIASGAVGTFCYIHYPRLMTRNRSSSSTADMLASIASLDGELRNAAMTLDDTSAALIRRTTEVTLIGGSWWRQLSGRYPNCATQRALALLDRGPREREPQREALVRTVRIRLDQRAFLLGRLRRDIRYKALMDAWLYLHVPLAFALLAALLAHVLAIFFLW